MSGYLRRFLTHKTVEFYAVLTVLAVLPILLLAVLGGVYVWQAGWGTSFMLVMLALGLVLLLIVWIFKRTEPEQEELVESLAPKADWSNQDMRIWQQAKQRIDSERLVETHWPDLLQVMMSQLTFVAKCYHEGEAEAEYAATLPEFLLMLEVCSKDYRALILQNVPLVQTVKISTAITAFQYKEKLTTGYAALQWGYRVLRMVTAAPTAVMAEARGALMGPMMEGVSAHLQQNLKKLLFEELSQVAIELYSGRLKLSDEELRLYQQRLAGALDIEPVKPLSIVVIGQVNAGKSSLVNALADQCLSEIDVIQAGDKIARHRLQLTDEMELELVDTPGINGEKRTGALLLKEATQADLVLWLSSANQPAKELDSQLIRQWNAYFNAHIERRPPPILLVTTHNDQLKPRADWDPPYDLNESDNKKVSTMLDALHYTQQILDLPAYSSAVPVSLAPDRDQYNIDSVKDLILGLSEDARASQLNKDRVQAIDGQPLAKAAWGQLAGIGRVVGKLALMTDEAPR